MLIVVTLSDIMPSADMQSVVTLSDIMPSADIQSVALLSVIILTVMAPQLVHVVWKQKWQHSLTLALV
jgi:hypothetical protein